MALSEKDLKLLSEKLDEEVRGKKISKFTQLKQGTFYFQLSNKDKLVINLDQQNPAVYISKTLRDFPSINSQLSTHFRKELSNAEILSVSVKENDRILIIELSTLNSLYQFENKLLLIELIPFRSAMILLDSNRQIEIASHYTSLDSPRPLAKGMNYTYPEAHLNPKKIEAEFDYVKYVEKQTSLEEQILAKRKKEIYLPLYRKIENKRKLLEKKTKLLEKDIEEAKRHLDDGQYGDIIFMCLDDFKAGTSEFDYEGMKIKLDPLKTPIENAEAYYKRAKKAKKAIVVANENLEKAKKEMNQFNDLSDLLKEADESILSELAIDLGVFKSPKKKKPLEKAIFPYRIKNGQTTYLFGKNAKQNDFLTFTYDLSPNHIWMHILGDFGSHLIIKKQNPSEDEIFLGACFCLLGSKKEDGEVTYSLRKDVKKGSVSGQAELLNYKVIRINSIPDFAKQLYNSAEKVLEK